MRILPKLILFTISNSLALILVDFLIDGVSIQGDITTILSLAGALALINFFLGTLIKIILTPFIIITLGLLTIAINAGLLYILDLLSPSLTINTLTDLVTATVIIGIISIIVRFSAKNSYKKTHK